MKPNLTPAEEQEQKALLEWCDWNGFTNYFAIPNGGHRNKVVASKLKAQGVKAGVPDILFHVSRDGYHGLFLELKRLKGGRVSDAQAMMMAKLTGCGYRCVVAYGFEEAKNTVVEYMKGEV